MNLEESLCSQRRARPHIRTMACAEWLRVPGASPYPNTLAHESTQEGGIYTLTVTLSSKAATIGDDTNELSNITAEFLLFDFEHALLGFPIALDPHSFPLSMPHSSPPVIQYDCIALNTRDM